MGDEMTLLAWDRACHDAARVMRRVDRDEHVAMNMSQASGLLFGLPSMFRVILHVCCGCNTGGLMNTDTLSSPLSLRQSRYHLRRHTVTVSCAGIN
jgi:hypothetical protein